MLKKTIGYILCSLSIIWFCGCGHYSARMAPEDVMRLARSGETKISEMQEQSSPPTTGEIVFAYSGHNYKVQVQDLIDAGLASPAAIGSSVPAAITGTTIEATTSINTDDDLYTIYGSDSDFRVRYNSSSGYLEIRNAAGDILLYVDTNGTIYAGQEATHGGIEIDPTPDTNQTCDGITIQATVAENTIGFGGLLVWKSDGFNDYDADTAAAADAKGLLGMACESGTGTKIILLKGFIRDDSAWDWDGYEVLYGSESAGDLEDTVGNFDGGDTVRPVGRAYSADVVFFDPSVDWHILVSE